MSDEQSISSTDVSIDTGADTQISQVDNLDTTQTQDDNLEENNSSSDTTTSELTDDNTASEIGDTGATQADATSTETVEALQSRLKEYELREEEALRIRERLSLPKVDPQVLQYETIEAQINNQSQREWIKLCNKFGVDYTPEGIEKSCNELESKDPKAYYQFKAEIDRFANTVQSQKSAIINERKNYEIQSFYNQNKDLLDNSPVINQLVSNYVQQNYSALQNPSQELSGLMSAIKTILLEGVEVGKAVSQVEKAKQDKSKVGANSSIATANSQAYNMQSQQKWTRDRINNLSIDEYAKYAKEIDKAMLSGEIE